MNGYTNEVHGQKVETVFIDLDDTLYPAGAVSHEMRIRMKDYAVNDLGIPAEDALNRVREFGSKYGTSLAGFVAEGYPVDIEKYFHDTHELIDLPNILAVDPALNKMLSRLNKPKYIFTNGNTKHANRVLKILGLSDMFKDIISFDTLQELGKSKGLCDGSRAICKPASTAFELALEQAGAQAGSTLFLDDNVKNIVAAQNHGISSILVGTSDAPGDVHVAIKSLHDLTAIRPDLFAE